MTSLDDVSALIAALERDLPLARSCVDQGDGLRSPALGGRVSGGGGSDPVGELAVAGYPEPDADGRLRRPEPKEAAGARGRLQQAERYIERERVELVNAYADAHRRTKEEKHG